MSASLYSIDDILSLTSKTKSATKKRFNFNGLLFNFNKFTTTCKKLRDSKLSCILNNNNAKGTLTIDFEAHKIKSPNSINLLELNRLKSWKNQYKLLNNYNTLQQKTKIGTFKVQKAKAYFFNNLLFPLLLESFDVVTKNNMAVSISIMCFAQDWPKFEDAINNFKSSLSLSAGK